jgi:hypothetical protein
VVLVASAIVLRRTVASGGAGGAPRLHRGLWVGLLVVAMPYITIMRMENGEWRITGKKPVLSLLRFENRGPGGSARGAIGEGPWGRGARAE